MASFDPWKKIVGSIVPGFNIAVEDDSPLYAELFNADQMEQHGRTLAASHVIGKSTRDRLLQRLDENEQVLIATRDLLTESVKTRTRVTPAAEWLLDNFYLIEEQIQTAKHHLPETYSRQLPRLALGPSNGLPRVYDLALAVIAHSDGRVHENALQRFIAAYQEISPLKLGELWAIPIMLRLALVENLRRVSARLTSARLQVNQAQEWADKMLEKASTEPRDLILVLADMARSKPTMQSAFVAELTRRLQGHGAALALPLTWIEQSLVESSLTIEQLILSENQQQATDQVAISNSIASLRLLGAIDWRLFVEAMSGVEQTLREDPAQTYALMDFATRDRYRHVIGNLGRYTDRSEIEIARAAIKLAQYGDQHEVFASHVGYYLVDHGYPQLEAAVKAKLPLHVKLKRQLMTMPMSLHAGAIVLLTLAITGMLLSWLPPATADGDWSAGRWALALLVFIGCSQLSTMLVNWLATRLVSPDQLPRMDYSKGVPDSMRTLVAVPTMLSNADTVTHLLEDLEIRFLGNRDPHLHFALLTDFPDADAEVLETDAALLQQAREGIERLNAKYADQSDETDHTADSFFLFHRPRRWNAADKVWMGYERKRGKLAALNALLRGNDEEFAVIVGDIFVLQNIPYVITLDTDTELPRDSARQLIATMSHPLNRPRYDTEKKLIVGGYTILQPGVAASLEGAQRSRYAQLCGSEPGIDPYTRTVSDVYQDLYCEGSFIGKGIYEIDAFEYVLGDRFPENRILSHDLLEGCYARSGLVTDIRFYEEYPTRYTADASRQHRWIRGDWQIANWMLPRVPGPQRTTLPNPLSALSRWKIFDNLRRSVVPVALVGMLLYAWFTGAQAWSWTIAVMVGFIVLQPLLAALLGLFMQPEDVTLKQYLIMLRDALFDNIALGLFRFACLPHEAWLSLDAIARVHWRLWVSRRGLLEWRPAASDKHGRDGSLAASYSHMWIAPLLALRPQLSARLTAP
ncbi:MAG: cyclic beta 1-2 glucan synthetase, partial [Pseudomonadota bacterium]